MIWVTVSPGRTGIYQVCPASISIRRACSISFSDASLPCTASRVPSRDARQHFLGKSASVDHIRCSSVFDASIIACQVGLHPRPQIRPDLFLSASFA